MGRDIDHAAIAVRTAMLEKFSKQNELEGLEVAAGEKTISVRHGERAVEGSRDDLLAAVRKAETFADFWEVLVHARLK